MNIPELKESVPYRINIDILEKKYPGFEKAITEALEQEQTLAELSHFTLEKSKGGDPTALLAGKFIHSRFDPRKEAERLIRKEIAPRITAVLFEGFGLGYQVEAFLDLFDSASAFILEPSPRRFLTALAARPMEKMLSCEDLTLMVGASPEALVPVLNALQSEKSTTIRLRPLYEADPGGFAPYDEVIRAYYSRKEVNNATIDRFATTWIRNLIRNLDHLAEAGDVGVLKDRFRGMPALILAAGPTLDPVLDQYEEISKRTLVIAVDTACRALTLRGIRPDILVVVDPQYWNSRHLDRADLTETVLVSESSTHPVIFRHKAEHLLFCGSVFPLGIVLEHAVGRNSRITAGGSVATTAFSLASFMGADAIYLAGLDLGYPGGQTHFNGSFFEQRGHSFSSRFSPFEHFTHRIIHEAGRRDIPSYDGEMIPSDSRLSVYRSWFTEQISGPGIPPVFNLDGRSAAIEGIGRQVLADLLNRPEIESRKRELLRSLPRLDADTVEARRRTLYKAEARLAAELERLAELSEGAQKISEEAERNFSSGKPTGHHSEILSKIDEQLLSVSSREVASFLIQPYLRSFSIDAADEDGETNSFRKSTELYRTISGAARSHLAFFTHRTQVY